MTPEERDAAEAGPYFLMRDQRDALLEAAIEVRDRLDLASETYRDIPEGTTTAALMRAWANALDKAIQQCPGAFPDDP